MFLPQNIKDFPKDLSYSLRFPAELRTTEVPSDNKLGTYNWHTDMIYPSDGYNSPRNLYYDDGGPPSYYKEGFLAIQNAIAAAFILKTGNQIIPNILVKRFPYPTHTIDSYMQMLQMIAPLCVLFSFSYTFSNSVRFIAIEKEKQLKEAMKIMGLPSWTHWLR